MFRTIKEGLALRQWKKSALGAALQHHGHEFFWADYAPFAYLDEKVRLQHCAELHAAAVTIVGSENPVLAAREGLASYVHTFAPLMVSGMQSNAKSEVDVYDTPYISASLRSHVEQISEHDDELGRLLFDEPEMTAEELANYCTTRASLLLFYCNGMNLISIALEDRAHRQSDWYKAYMQAAMVWAEDQIRAKIGLASLLPGATDGLAYSAFMNYVLSGEPDPFYSWCKAFPDRYLYGRGSHPHE